MKKTNTPKAEPVKFTFSIDGKTVGEIVNKSAATKYKAAMKAQKQANWPLTAGKPLTEKQQHDLLIGFANTTSTKEGDLILDLLRDRLDGMTFDAPIGPNGDKIKLTVKRKKQDLHLVTPSGEYLARAIQVYNRGENDKSLSAHSPFTTTGIVKSKQGFSIFVNKS